MGGYLMKKTELANTQPRIEDFVDINDTSEGITFDGKGYLYVTSYNRGKVLKISHNKTVSDFASGLIGPAAIAFDGNHNFYVCECGKFITLPFLNVVLPFTSIRGKITRIDPDGTKTFFLQADEERGLHGSKRTRQIKHPNGMAVKRNGVVYVSEMSGFVVRIEGDSASVLFSFSNLLPLDIGLRHSPNGMVLSQDEKFLYVNDMRSGDVWKVSLDEEGYMADKERLPLRPKSLPQADGIVLDEKGYLYITYKLKNIARVSPQTGVVEDIYCEDELNTPANIAFGYGEGFDNKSIYITQLGLKKDLPKAKEATTIKKMYIGNPGQPSLCPS